MALNFLVVDSNVFASALLKDSFTRRFLLSDKAPGFFCPDFLKEELLKHSKYFSKKLGISEEKVIFNLEQLFEASRIKIVEKKEYQEFMQRAQSVCPDPTDVQYFALALKLECPLWSQEKILKKQDAVKVLNTKEVLKEFE